MNAQRVLYVDQSAEFWPSGWMVYVSVLLGVTDVSLLAYVATFVMRGHP